MRIRRSFLFWGLLLIPLGGIPLLVQAGYLDADLLTDVWRWWPLILIGLGLALLLGRTQAGLVGTVVVALVLGTLGGAALASGPTWLGSITECAGPGGEMSEVDQSGTLTGPATVTLDLDCGTVDLTTEAGSAWRLHAEYRGTEPRVDGSASALTVRTPGGGGSHRHEWDVTVGADALDALDITLNAGSASAAVAGAALSRVVVDMNAGDLLIDGTAAAIRDIDASVNAGRLRITLDDGPTSGDLSANAGSIELCVPPEATLQFEVTDQLTFATNLKDRGLIQSGETWTRDGSGATIDLEVDGNAASFTLDPDGGCK